MKKVIRLTESDLTKIVKRVINEQKFQILSKLLSNSGDDLVKAYGDDVVKQLDDVFASALRNPRTTGVNQLGKQFLKSASGTEVELETISRILNAVSKGANIDDLARYLPSKLADGTDFRTVLQSKLATSKKLPAGAVGAAAGSGGVKLSNFAPGTVVNSSSFKDEMINWANVSNAKNLNDYNKMIATALQTGNFQSISRGGFEKYGISNFRDFLMKGVNKEKKVMFSPSTGQWFFQAL
jgi:hypothetical protein